MSTHPSRCFGPFDMAGMAIILVGIGIITMMRTRKTCPPSVGARLARHRTCLSVEEVPVARKARSYRLLFGKHHRYPSLGLL